MTLPIRSSLLAIETEPGSVFHDTVLFSLALEIRQFVCSLPIKEYGDENCTIENQTNRGLVLKGYFSKGALCYVAKSIYVPFGEMDFWHRPDMSTLMESLGLKKLETSELPSHLKTQDDFFYAVTKWKGTAIDPPVYRNGSGFSKNELLAHFSHIISLLKPKRSPSLSKEEQEELERISDQKFEQIFLSRKPLLSMLRDRELYGSAASVRYWTSIQFPQKGDGIP